MDRGAGPQELKGRLATAIGAAGLAGPKPTYKAYRMMRRMNDEDMSHGLVVPIVILWIVWRERKRWMALSPQPSGWGLALLAVAAGVQFLSVMGAGLFAGSVAFLLSVAGAVLCLGGPAFLRTWAGDCLQPGDAALATPRQPPG